MRLLHYLITFSMFICSLLSTQRLSAQVDIENVLIMGRRAIGATDYVSSISFFNKVIEVRPKDNRAYYYRAYAKFSLEDYEGAEKDCTLALERNPFLTEVCKLRGLCRIHLRNFKGAADDYSKVIEEFPDEDGTRYNRALCRLESGDIDGAEEDVDFMLNRWKHMTRPYLVKAQIKLERKDTIGGILWIDSLLKIDSKEADAWAFKGKYELSVDNYERADSFLTHAIQLQENNFDNYLVRAQARSRMNLFGIALADYDKVIELVPEHFIAHYNRGLLRALVGDDNRAIEDFDFVIQKDSTNTLAIYNRALLREQTGDFSGAISDYTQLIDSFPNFLYGYEARGKCRRKLGDIRGALADETMVAKGRLDMTFRPNKSKTIKKVRKESDRQLENYEALIEEDNDYKESLLGKYFGKIQNKEVEFNLLKIYSFAFRNRIVETILKNTTLTPEIEKLNKLLNNKLALTFDNEQENNLNSTDTENLLKILIDEFDKSFSNFIESILIASTYDYEQALVLINKAIELNPNNFLYYIHQSNIYQNSAKFNNEVIKLNQDLSSDPSNLIKHEWQQKAISSLDNAIKLNSNLSYLYYNRGCLYAEIGKLSQAIADFTHSIKLDPYLAEPYFNRAILYLRNNQEELSYTDFSKAGELGINKAYSLLKQSKKLGQFNKTTKND